MTPNVPQTMSSLSARGVTTRILHLGEDLGAFCIEHLEPLVAKGLVLEGCVLAVTSKIAALAERAIIAKSEATKAEVIAREADYDLGDIGHGVRLTIKDGLFIPSAGIDESNAEGNFYILYPRKPYEVSRDLRHAIIKHFGLKNFGIILTDSHTMPLRRGVTGIGLSYWGFRASVKLVGTEDLFGRAFAMTYINNLDSLAVTAVAVMGEGVESRPLAILHPEGLEFYEGCDRDQLEIAVEEDLYAPIYKNLLQGRQKK